MSLYTFSIETTGTGLDTTATHGLSTTIPVYARLTSSTYEVSAVYVTAAVIAGQKTVGGIDNNYYLSTGALPSVIRIPVGTSEQIDSYYSANLIFNNVEPRDDVSVITLSAGFTVGSSVLSGGIPLIQSLQSQASAIDLITPTPYTCAITIANMDYFKSIVEPTYFDRIQWTISGSTGIFDVSSTDGDGTAMGWIDTGTVGISSTPIYTSINAYSAINVAIISGGDLAPDDANWFIWPSLTSVATYPSEGTFYSLAGQITALAGNYAYSYVTPVTSLQLDVNIPAGSSTYLEGGAVTFTPNWDVSAISLAITVTGDWPQGWWAISASKTLPTTMQTNGLTADWLFYNVRLTAKETNKTYEFSNLGVVVSSIGLALSAEQAQTGDTILPYLSATEGNVLSAAPSWFNGYYSKADQRRLYVEAYV